MNQEELSEICRRIEAIQKHLISVSKRVTQLHRRLERIENLMPEILDSIVEEVE